MTKNIVIGVLAIALVLSLGVQFLGTGTGGQLFREVGSFTQGLRAGTTRQLSISNAGLLTTTGGITNSGTLTQSGTSVFSAELQGQNIIEGGGVQTLSSTSTLTLTAADVCNYRVNAFSGTAVESTTTLPATTTLVADCLDTNGDSIWTVLRQASSTVTTTVVAGAGITLVGDDAGHDVLVGGTDAFIRFIRVSAAEIIAYIVEVTDAD